MEEMLLRVLFCLFAVNYDISIVSRHYYYLHLTPTIPGVFSQHCLHCLPSYFRPFMESKLKSSQRAAITRQIDHYKLMASSEFKYCYKQ